MNELDLLRNAPDHPISADTRARLLQRVGMKGPGAGAAASPIAPASPPHDAEPSLVKIEFRPEPSQGNVGSTSRQARRVASVAAALLLVVGGAVAVSLQHRDAPAEIRSTDAPADISPPSIRELATIAGSSASLHTPPNGYQHLKTRDVRMSYQIRLVDQADTAGDRGSRKVALSTVAEEWIAADGSGRVTRTQTQLDSTGAPLSDQMVGFGVPATTDLGESDRVWSEANLKTAPSTPTDLRTWLQGQGLLPADADGSTTVNGVGHLLSWPVSPPATRAAAIELLGELGATVAPIEGSPSTVKVALSPDAWLVLSRDAAAVQSFRGGVDNPEVTIIDRGLTAEMPAS